MSLELSRISDSESKCRRQAVVLQSLPASPAAALARASPRALQRPATATAPSALGPAGGEVGDGCGEEGEAGSSGENGGGELKRGEEDEDEDLRLQGQVRPACKVPRRSLARIDDRVRHRMVLYVTPDDSIKCVRIADHNF